MLVTGDFSEKLVGSNHDAGGIAGAALAGTSVLVAGPLGSGKSHLLRAVTRRLEDAGASPVLLHPGRSLTRIPFGAIGTWPADRSILLQDSELRAKNPVVVVIDDVQDLDAASADLVAQAICRRRAVAIAGMETPRARLATDSRRASSANVLVDLWLRGFADRIDLREMTLRDAEELLALFPGASELDTSTRAAVIGLADGSRILLRELAAQAVTALRTGMDPLASIDDVHHHTRLGDAVAAHVAELGETDRTALALLERVRGIEYADVTRFVASSTIDGLLAVGLVHEDGTSRRRLMPNATLAREAGHQLPRGALDAILDDAAFRMLAPDAGWWSEPVAAATAERWHEASRTPEHVAVASAEQRALVARAGARRANDHGRLALAAAYSRLPTGMPDAASLRVERAYADALLGTASSSEPFVLEDLDEPALRRHIRLQRHVIDRAGVLTLTRIAHVRPLEDSTLCEIDVAVATQAALAFDWRTAQSYALQAIHREQGHSATRLRAQLLSAVCHVELGSWSGALGALRSVDVTLRDPGAGRELDSSDRILALGTEVMITQSASQEVPLARQRLADAAVTAVHEGNSLAVALAGLASSLLYARAGESDRAIAELDATLLRTSAHRLGLYGDLLQLSVARSAALLGRPEDARRVLDRVSETTAEPTSLLEHDLALTESCILVGESRFEEAVAPALRASTLSTAAGSAPIRRLRDLYQLAALGEGDELLVASMQAIASDTDIAGAMLLTDSVQAMVEGRRGTSRRMPLEMLRAGAPWRMEVSPGASRESVFTPLGANRGPTRTAPQPPYGLTRREQEIAQLIARGLGNREIAEQLFLSVRTVESHVYQARAKLGAKSRSDLGRMVVRGSRAPLPDTGARRGHQ